MILFAITIIDISSAILVALLYMSGRGQYKKDYRQILFNRMLLTMLCYFFVDFSAWCINGITFTGSHIVQLILNTGVFFVQIYYTFLWLVYSDYWLFQSMERLRRRKVLFHIPLWVETAMLIVNIFTGWIFQIDDAGTYIRGALYLPSMILFYIYDGAALCLAFRELILAKDRERRIYCLWLASFGVLPITASIILAVCELGFSIMAPFYALSLLSIYLFVHQKRLVEERENFAKREAELQRENVTLMLSQIQPHFLYNSLTAIASLCHSNAPEAEEATLEFSNYLRCNLDSIKSDKPIAFEQELKHTKNYLALEKRRFTKRLNLEWDIQDELFRIPALTLQPIVENAVKCGVTKRERGGTVWISSHRTEKGHVITVRDDGVGFDINALPADDRSHMGISCVRDRLRVMCGGTLEILSTPGEGTTATITIPEEVSAK